MAEESLLPPDLDTEFEPPRKAGGRKKAGKGMKKGGFKSGFHFEETHPMDQLSSIWRKPQIPSDGIYTDYSHTPFNPDKLPIDQILPRYVFSGRLEHIPPPKNRVVKIFLSSTFTDMYVERNYLLMNVYPELTRYCKNTYNLEFQVVDMRWGVRDEASNDHSGPKICMSELQSCKDLSLGPNFVCLLGQRYGGRPIQSEIIKTEFEEIIAALEAVSKEERTEKGVDIDLLKDWYREETNCDPPLMILTPLDVKGVSPAEFGRKVKSETTRSIFDCLHTSLRVGANAALNAGKLSKGTVRKYRWSVTEEEIYRGILSQGDSVKDHALCFQRTLIIDDKNLQHPKIRRFIEVKTKVLKDGTELNVADEEIGGYLEELCKETKEKLGEKNFVTFDPIPWSDKGGTNEDSLKEYLVQFGKLFTEKVKMLVERAAQQPDPLADHHFSNYLVEIAEHDHQAIAKNKTFQGREDIMSAIEKYIKSASRQPFVMFGDSGFGKTSLLAVASMRVFDWVGDTENLLIVRRFLGTTPDSTNIGSLIQSINVQLMEYFKFKIPSSDDPNKMLHFALLTLPKHARVIIFLDSLDQLSNYGFAHSLRWMPMILPDNVRFIVSTLPQEHGILDTLKQSIRTDRNYVEVNILEAELAIKLLNDWLSVENRKLTPEQSDIVATRFRNDKNTSPLFIKLIFDVVKQAHSYDESETFSSLLLEINSPVKCIKYIYRQLMHTIGPLLVHRVFAYLHLSNLGLTENELVDLISLDDEVLNYVFQYSDPPLRRLPATFWARIRSQIQEYLVTREANGGKVIAWYHRQFVEVGDEIFKSKISATFPDLEFKEESHTEMCDRLRELMVEYFTGVWAEDKPKPFQYSEEYVTRKSLSDRNSTAVRYVPAMPNVLEGGKPNRRKIGQLPQLLIKLGRIDQFFQEVFGNIEGLVGLFSMFSWSDIYELIDSVDFNQYKAIGKDKDAFQDKAVVEQPFNVLKRAFLLCSALAMEHPRMLGPLLLGRLIPFAAGSKILKDFCNTCFEKGPTLNAIVATHAQLEGVGSLLLFEMPNDHDGPCVAMKEVTPGGSHYIMTLSRKAVLLDMEDGSIVMRYQPPDLGKNDSFNLIASDPTEMNTLVLSLKIKPKVYIVSVKQHQVSGIIDCRRAEGCEEMAVQSLRVHNSTENVSSPREIVIIVGSAYEGMLIYDLKDQTLCYRFCNNRPIIFTSLAMARGDLCILVTQMHKASFIMIRKPKEQPAFLQQLQAGFQQNNVADEEELGASNMFGNSDLFGGDDDEDEVVVRPTFEPPPPPAFGTPEWIIKENKRLDPKREFSWVSDVKLDLPGDATITARVDRESELTGSEHSHAKAFSTDDGYIYFGGYLTFKSNDVLKVKPLWTRLLLDSPAHSITLGSEDTFSFFLCVCTKEYVYLIVVQYHDVEDKSNSLSKNVPNFVINSRILIQMKERLTFAICNGLSNEGAIIGYHLGQLKMYAVTPTSEDADSPIISVNPIIAIDAHPKPITGIIQNEDIKTMLLSADAGGSVRVFHLAAKQPEVVKEANRFDRMGTSIVSAAGHVTQAATVACENSDACIWDLSTGKIVKKLTHDLQSDEKFVQVVISDVYVATMTTDGMLSFWNIRSSDAATQSEPFKVVEISGFKCMSTGLLTSNQLLVQCKYSWSLFDMTTGDMKQENADGRYQVLKHSFIVDKPIFLMNDLEEDHMILDIVGFTRLNLTTDAPYAVHGGLIQDFFCYENVLVLCYKRCAVLFNWTKGQEISSVDVYKPTLITSNSGTFIIRSTTQITSYRINQGGIEEMSRATLLSRQDRARLTPDGRHLVVLQGTKMMRAFRSDALKWDVDEVGLYSLYGDIERLNFSADSQHLLLSITDTRLFVLMLIDPKLADHRERVKSLLIGDPTITEANRSRQLLNVVGDEQDSSDDEDNLRAKVKTSKQMNELAPANEIGNLLREAKLKIIINKMICGEPAYNAIMTVK